MQIIACIEDPVVIKQILEHLERRAQQPPAMTPTARAPLLDAINHLKRYLALLFQKEPNQ